VKLGCHRHLQGMREAPPCQLDLETVLALGFSVAHGRFRRLAKGSGNCWLTEQSSLGLGRSPRFGAHAAEGNTGLRHIPAGDCDNNRGLRQGEFV